MRSRDILSSPMSQTSTCLAGFCCLLHLSLSKPHSPANNCGDEKEVKGLPCCQQVGSVSLTDCLCSVRVGAGVGICIAVLVFVGHQSTISNYQHFPKFRAQHSHLP